MLISKEFLIKLKDFGLNSYESKIWTALLSLGTSTAGELSDIANVPRSRSYDVLESLEKKGFIISKPGKPITYISIPPEDVVERMKSRVSKEAEYNLKAIEKLKTHKIVEELKSLHSQGISTIDPIDLSGSIKGWDNIENQLLSMFKKAKKSITILTTKTSIEKNSDKFLSLFKDLNKKGVNIKIASNISKDHKLSGVAKLIKTNHPARYYVIDNADVLFMLMNDKEVHPDYDTAIWVNSPFFASILESIFNKGTSK